MGRQDLPSTFDFDQRFFAVPEDLSGCFTAITRLDIAVRSTDMAREHLQPEWGSVRFFNPAPGGAVSPKGEPFGPARSVGSGPSTGLSYYQPSSVRLWAVGFLPLGWKRFMNTDAADLANGLFDIEQHPGFAAFAPLADKLADAPAEDEKQYGIVIDHLQSIARPASEDDARVNRAHAALMDPDVCTASDFADHAGVTIRTLERLCARFFGFPPVTLLRRQRMMRSLTRYLLGAHSSWTGAIDASYHDQAHFVHEFRSFVGLSPGEYAEQVGPVLRTMMRHRAALLGQPAQTLDPPES